MNALVQVPQNMGAPSTRFQNQPLEDDLSSGISGGFGRIGFKGKVWAIHHRGESRQLLRNDGSGDPLGSIEVVILKASHGISKTYYAGGYVEGSTAAPDCLSSNGVTPDPTSPKPQCTSCAACPKNAWGSDIRQDGTAGKGKACKDTKRLAVVPLADITNEVYGGPMLLRVPAASLQDIATYGKAVNKLGYHYYGVATRIGFDAKEAFPKLTFSPIRALTDTEADLVLAHHKDPNLDRILAEDEALQVPAEPAVPAVQFELALAPAAVPVVAPVMATTSVSPATTTIAPPPATAGGFGADGRVVAHNKKKREAPAAPSAQAPAPQATKPKRQSRAAAQTAAADPAAAAGAAAGPSFDDMLDAELSALMGE